jgi:hypothetical protein
VSSNRKRRERGDLSACTDLPQGNAGRTDARLDLRGSVGVVGKGLVAKDACALARAENTVALVFAVKCGLVSGKRLHDGMRDVVTAFLTVGIAAANYEERRRLCNDDAAHVLRLGKAAVRAVFYRQGEAQEVRDRRRKSRRFVLPKTPFCKPLRTRAVLSKTIHAISRPS